MARFSRFWRNYLFISFLWLFAFQLSSIGQLVKLPAPPELSNEGRKLIYDFEVGGGEGYYNRFLSRPTWPGFASGCTIGLGYDTCFNSKQVILFDWNKLPERFRIAEMSGIGGEKAKIKLPEIRDIVIKWGLAEEVFNNTTVTKFWGLCRRTYPGFDELHPNAQAALLSLTFNRGNSMAGPKRVEMRAIRDLTAKKKYQEIADQIRKMKAIWRGTDIQKGMERRRDAEARLMETAK